MANYRDDINFVAHNFNNSIVKVGNVTLDGMHTISIKQDEPEVEVQGVNSGMNTFVESNDKKGTIVIEMHEASPSNLALWDYVGGQVKFSHADSQQADLSCSCIIKIVKPEIAKDKDVKMVEWTFVGTYLNMKSGGFNLVNEDDLE